MKSKKVIIIGGGLAGLTAGIHLAQKDVEVLLIEKNDFPHHKVCGEYLSNEVLPYLEQLEVPLMELRPKRISRLCYSTSKGKSLEVELPLGGLGLSRFALDNFLFEKAVSNGVKVIQDKVTEVHFTDNEFEVKTLSGVKFRSNYVFSAYGKRSLLDKKLNRKFFQNPAPWVAVKTHLKADFPDDLVALHNFRGGYCGLSMTENNEVNLCYLATFESFKKFKDPDKFNERVLRKNPFLDKFLSNSSEVFEQPLTIAQVSFSQKSSVEDHQLMLGDAAGLIHPLCGNGMAMAIHSAKLASEVLLDHLHKSSSREEMEKNYELLWDQHFNSRLRTGKWLQKLLLKDSLAEFSQAVISKMPFLLPHIIRRTHGNPIL